MIIKISENIDQLKTDWRDLIMRTVTMNLNSIDPESIDRYASIGCSTFGDILLAAMNYDADCTFFCRCSEIENAYNIGWVTESGAAFARTFPIQTLMRYINDSQRSLTISFSIDREDGTK